ncbi:prepilin peptidase [Kineococcus radiotolerans]|uniref:prepilin peptidase n=1 Tax=Kineococcus radiotolerans TaxID=131568 RepID=UPI0012FF1D7F|nr:prepilin peptidase [Kineococcus radiotolerans]
MTTAALVALPLYATLTPALTSSVGGVGLLVGVAAAAAVLAGAAQPWLGHRAGLLGRPHRAGAAAVTGLLTLLSCLAVGQLRPALLATALTAAVTYPLFTVDLKQKRLPIALVRPVTGWVLVTLSLDALLIDGGGRRMATALAGAVAGAVVFHGLRVISRGGMGRGDVRLASLLGLLLGWLSPATALLGLALSFVLAAAALVPFLLTHRLQRHTKVPFGPFMLVGAWTAVGLHAVAFLSASGVSSSFSRATGVIETLSAWAGPALLLTALAVAVWTTREVAQRAGGLGPVVYPQPMTATAPGVVVREDGWPWRSSR